MIAYRPFGIQVRMGAGYFLTPRTTINAVRNAMNPSLRHAGGLVRKASQRLIRRRRDRTIHSAPGSPPYTHTGALKRSILFGFTAITSVIIGPAASVIGRIGHTHEFGGVEGPKRNREGRSIIRLLRIGGTGPIDARDGQLVYARIRTERQLERARRIHEDYMSGAMGIRRPERRTWYGNRRYPPRPYMRPALLQVRGKLANLWRNSVRQAA
jgi:hypothetical protein